MSVADNNEKYQKLENKRGTMYLSVINSQDAKIRPLRKLYTQRDWSANLYNLDIESSHPKKFGIFTNKIDFINKVDDIERANPKIIHYHLKKPEYNLSNKDIEKSSPSAFHFKTKRVTNPLQPEYKFSEIEKYPPEIPKFIRDSMDIKDISGASPHKQIYCLKRETISEKIKKIEGARSRIPYIRRSVGNTKYDYMDYSDVNNFVFKTKRHTNALEPIYIFKKEGIKESFFYGPIDKSKPESKYPYYYKPSLNLKINDIKGENPGSTNYIKKFKGNNFGLDVSDIPKANSGSLKKGIITSRCTNPLMPKYQYIGEREEENIRNNNLISLKKKCKSIPLISSTNEEKENEKNKEKNIVDNNDKFNVEIKDNNKSENFDNNRINGANSQNIKIIKNIYDKDKLYNRLNKFKINKFNINILQKDKNLKKSNSTMNLVNHDMKLEENNGKNKKIIRFTPLLESQKSKLINNTNVNFDRTIFGKKPFPFYGYSHDSILQSKENNEHLEEIEKAKQEKEIRKVKYNQYILNKNNNYITEEYKKNPNENNLLFISDNPSIIQTNQIKKKNVDEWYNYNFNDKTGLFKYKNKSFSMRHLGPKKKLYSEQIDSFVNINNIQKNIDDRNNYVENFEQQINPSEYTRRALLE